jgi:hypothetical protein
MPGGVAALTLPATPGLQDIQRLLDPDTVLLEYALASGRSYLWAVTQDSMRSFELPGRKEIEPAARAVYDTLTARNLRPEGETDEARQRRLAAADAGLPAGLAGLSRTLLAPAAARLAGRRRVVVVADGALQYIPFAALHDPSRSQQGDVPLAENVEVFLVAIVIALGVRTYFLQPFTIPTGSMQPTLNCVIGYPTAEPPP